MDELVSIYERLRESIKCNSLPSRFSYPAKPLGVTEDLIHTDTLAKTLGFSIAATEIAQRGVQSEPGFTLLDKISSLTLDHLRILSETASSYIAIGGMMSSGSSTSAKEFSETNNHQLLQLFAGHPQISGTDPDSWSKLRIPPALTQDAFNLLAECSICLVPAFNLDIHHIIHLCYLLEIVQVVLNLFPGKLDKWLASPSVVGKVDENPVDLRAFNGFLFRVCCFVDPHHPRRDENFPYAHLRPIYTAVTKYALPFLRKAAILLHIRYGVDFPDAGFADIDEPELNRLTKALRLPTLPSIFAMLGDVTNEKPSVPQLMVAGWIGHLKWTIQKHPGADTMPKGLKSSHPAIFELIGLPKHYDTLTYETMRRKCPSTGKELVDPTLCLFCGDIFCSQATCCHKEGKGGCNQHMKK